MKRLLILGGSQQIGRRLIEKIVLDGVEEYDIYTFNRGKTNPHLFENQNIHKIIGDRNTDDINQILNYDWDIILDCSCYDPVSLRGLMGKLKGFAGRYVFISTISVYDYKKNVGKNELIGEDFDLINFTEAQIREEGFKRYGEKKVAAEKCLLESDLDVIILRPHFIYGRYDWQNLDFYWIDRIQKYEHLLVPGGNDLIHRTFIDDLIAIVLQSFELEQHQSVYNVVTHDPVSLKEYLSQMMEISEHAASLIPVDSEKLIAAEVRPIYDIPLWSNGSHFVFSTDKLKADFKTEFQSHYHSLAATLAWNKEIANWESGKSNWESGKMGLTRQKELALIQKENRL